MTGAFPFALHPALDTLRYAEVFAKTRRVRISPFLAEDAAAKLAAHLEARDDWRLVLNAGDKVFELGREGQEQLSEAQRRALDEKVAHAARTGFQYRFESVRVADAEEERVAAGTVLDRFASFMASERVLSRLREITGLDAMHYADAQATGYGPGHFLTRHDDDVAGKNRLGAYVFGLTHGWSADWGGLLIFHDGDSSIAEARAPAFNALDIFAVPQPHSVTMVTPFAGRRRLSITGWLRSVVPGGSEA